MVTRVPVVPQVILVPEERLEKLDLMVSQDDPEVLDQMDQLVIEDPQESMENQDHLESLEVLELRERK